MKHYRTLAIYRSSKGGYWTVKIDENGGLSCKHLILAREEFGDKIEAVRQHGLSVVESPFLPVDY